MSDPVDLAAIADQWHPRRESRTELLVAGPSRALAALLNQPVDAFADEAALPPMWTTLHFLDRVAQCELGADGHPHEGNLLPPIPGRRRMFAGGSLEVIAPLRFGDEVLRETEVSAVTIKSGRSGQLLFVTVRHRYRVRGEVRLIEEQDIVYRSAFDDVAGPTLVDDSSSHVLAADAVWSLTFDAEPSALFRFSALTYNAHRIHYDLPYAVTVESLPGLLVQGPLLVVLALELPRRHASDKLVRRLNYRARRPVVAGQAIVAAAPNWSGDAARPLEIRVRHGVAMTAEVDLEYGTAD